MNYNTRSKIIRIVMNSKHFSTIYLQKIPLLRHFFIYDQWFSISMIVQNALLDFLSIYFMKANYVSKLSLYCTDGC